MAATANYLKLLSDPRAVRQILVEGLARKPDGLTIYGSFGDEGWNTDADEARPHVHFHRAVLEGFNVESNLLQPDGTIRGLGTSTLGAVVIDNYDGAWDAWSDYSVDQQPWKVLMVGYLGDGPPVRYTDALSMPLLVGQGIGKPQVGDEMRIFLRSPLGYLEVDAQPELYAPQCPAFPGSATECIDFGDNFDLPAGSWTLEGFFYTEDPTLSGQSILKKDPGVTNGWNVDIGTAGDGVLRAKVREQANDTTLSAVGLVKQRRWTHFAVVFDSALSQRRLVMDGTTVTITAGVTGNVVNTTSPFRVGLGLKGRVSWIRLFSGARSDATIRAEMYLPRLGTETNLLWDLRLDEGKLVTTADRKSGSVITGTLTSGVLWTASAWIGSALAGRHRRLVLGRALDVELVPRDATKLIFEAGIGPLYSILPYSMANALAGGTFTNDLTRGLVTLAPGTNFGRLTADVTGVVPWGWCLDLDGVNDRAIPASAINCPRESMTLAALFANKNPASASDFICGFQNGAAAGQRVLRRGAPGTDTIVWEVRDDAGAVLSCTGPCPPLGQFAYVAGTIETSTASMRLVVNGWTVATTSTGASTFSTRLSIFGVGTRPDALGTANATGCVDAVGIFAASSAVALTDPQIQVLALRELQAGDVAAYGLLQGWNFNEGSGISVANVVVGQPALTLSGSPAWAASRSATVDLVIWLLLRAPGITFGMLNTAMASAFLRDCPGEAGWIVEEETLGGVVNDLLMGVGAALVEDGTALNLDLVRLPSGAESVKLTERDLIDTKIQPQPLGPDSWAVTVLHAHTWSVLGMEDVASIAASNAARYNKATTEWQIATAQDPTVLAASPGARNDLEFKAPLTQLPDADALAKFLLSVYRPGQRALAIDVDTSALGLRPLGEVSLSVTELSGLVRFGGVNFWRIVTYRKEETNYRLVIWRRA